MTEEQRRQVHKSWRWLRWLLVLLAVAVGFAACVFMTTVHPKNDVLPFESNYPHLNPHPGRKLIIQGTMPENVPIEFLAYYAASLPNLRAPIPWQPEDRKYESCYRSIPLGPTISLHRSEILKVVRRGSRYEVSVVVDKYEPGHCRWSLDAVTYRILNSHDDKLRASEAGWYGTTVAYLVGSDPSARRNDVNRYWRGRVDVWCQSTPTAEDPQHPETCGVLGGFSHDYSASIPADERGMDASTAVFPDTEAVEVNFHDLTAWIAEHGADK